jgi:catechol 2,3-dioxygenase-like lactoylglutathione lyase family enzyme
MKVWLDGVTLQVADVDESKAYYLQFPGVDVEYERPGEFALLRMGAARLGLLALGPAGFHLELATDDVDGLHDDLVERGVEVLGPPEDRPWGERTFNMIDPDGNLLELGEDAG